MAAEDVFGSSRREEETKRPARLLQIIEMIAVAPKRYRRRDLARRFEVSERMIQKDLQIIRHGLKCDLLLEEGGYYLESVPHLPPVQYTFTEAIALLTAVQAAQHVTGVGSPDLAAAVARVEALFPPESADLLQRASRPPAVSARSDHRHALLVVLNQALVEERKVKLVYSTRSRGGEMSERVVHPYELLPYERSWQLIAFCELRGAVLMFKIDRIQQANVLGERYRRPADFDVAAYLGEAWGIVRREEAVVEGVVLRFEADAGQRVMEEEWHPSQEVAVEGDGRVVVRFETTVTPELVGWVLRWGSRVEVLAPEGLREEVANQVELMRRLYQ